MHVIAYDCASAEGAHVVNMSAAIASSLFIWFSYLILSLVFVREDKVFMEVTHGAVDD